jgi:nucleoside-triphosphatase THEP1
MTLREIFKQAYRNLDLFPLIDPEPIQAFRVDYGLDTLERLAQVVDDAPSHGKVIFTGHRGCGKSTLLARFAEKMRPDGYFVVMFSISDMVEMSAVDHVNILYAMAIQLLSRATKQKITIAEKIKQEVLGWTTTERVSTSSKGVSQELGLGGDLLQFVTAKLKAESGFRDEVKKKYEKQISALVHCIDVIAQSIRDATKKEILIIIDDLDKLDWKLVEEVYKNNINALFQPSLKVVFTIPIAVIRELELRNILYAASGSPIQQMEVAKFFHRAERHEATAVPNAAKLEVFLQVLTRRLPSQYLEPETARAIVLKSGGVMRELVRITRACCSECSLLLRQAPERTDVKINADILALALQNLRNEFEVSLGQGRYRILQTTYENAKPEKVNDPAFLELLHRLYLLEYRNDGVWYDVHPIVVDLLKQEQLVA